MQRRQNGSLRGLLLLSIFVILFTSSISAQNLPKLTESTDNAIPVATSGGTAAATATDSPSKTAKGSAAQTSDDAKTASNSDLPNISSKSSAAATTAAATTDSPPPRISTDNGSTDVGLPSGLPTLPGGFKYPTPSVPPTANAPYMKKSNLPEGTVFIAVGAALGFIGLIILAWRGLVAWSINRSVKQAALKQSYQAYGGTGDSKSLLRHHKAAPYSDVPGSTMSLEKLGNHHRTNTSSHSKSRAPSSSLFFSPTAGAGMHTNHRNSGYLPAGYYAAGTSVPGGGSGMTHIGGPGATSMRPTSQGYMRPRSMGPSPPGSPSLAPSSRGADTAYAGFPATGVSTHASTSTLNLSAPPQGRAPSAYLEDLFENHPPGSNPLDIDRR